MGLAKLIDGFHPRPPDRYWRTSNLPSTSCFHEGAPTTAFEHVSTGGEAVAPPMGRFWQSCTGDPTLRRSFHPPVTPTRSRGVRNSPAPTVTPPGQARSSSFRFSAGSKYLVYCALTCARRLRTTVGASETSCSTSLRSFSGRSAGWLHLSPLARCGAQSSFSFFRALRCARRSKLSQVSPSAMVPPGVGSNACNTRAVFAWSSYSAPTIDRSPRMRPPACRPSKANVPRPVSLLPSLPPSNDAESDAPCTLTDCALRVGLGAAVDASSST